MLQKEQEEKNLLTVTCVLNYSLKYLDIVYQFGVISNYFYRTTNEDEEEDPLNIRSGDGANKNEKRRRLLQRVDGCIYWRKSRFCTLDQNKDVFGYQEQKDLKLENIR